MANRAFLVGRHEGIPVGPTTDSYDAHKQVLCAASYQLPVFWLVCFGEADLTEFVVEGRRIPTAVSDMVAVRARLAERASFVADVFGDYSARWADWVGFIEACEFPFLALDGYEVWAMGPDEFAAHLPRAVRWFSSRSPTDRRSLFWMAGIDRYDDDKRTVVCNPGEGPGRFLHGCGWAREVPWDENADT